MCFSKSSALFFVAVLTLPGCKGWFSSVEDTGDSPAIIDPDTGDTEDTDTDTDTDTDDTGEVQVDLPPSAPEIEIEPAEPTENDDLTCAVKTQSVDPEGEAVTYHYVWDVDGQNPEIETETVSASETWPGQIWTCRAWASDGNNDSDYDEAAVEIEAACYDTGAGEPNDSEADALSLGEMKDSEDRKTIEGVLDGHTDKDWYLYVGRDTATGWMSPGLEISGGNVPVRACLFASCLNGLGKTEVECEDGSEDSISPSGLPGCCSYADFDIDLNCASTTNDEAAMYIKIYTDMEDVCEPYSVNYGY
jgi:hypothetical protein